MKGAQSPVSNDFGMFTIGSVSSVREFRTDSKLAKTLPADFPVLTCLLEQADPTSFQKSPPQVACGFGSIPLAGDQIMTIRLQIGGTQVYWLADMTDPEVWSTIDTWTVAEKLPFALEFAAGKKRNCLFGIVDIPRKDLNINRFRFNAGKEMPDGIWDELAELAASGVMQIQATSDIPGIRLRQVCVNVLMTQRLRAFTKANPFADKPVFATAGSSGAAHVH
ncbi:MULTISPECIES: hypothetical protein [Paraburkholderia]|jgi:hypothetical protein|uniref:hypothetical protein n=1 Tax=Paraburkholderia TaxID=1822464 RepID=UPI0038B8DC1D